MTEDDAIAGSEGSFNDIEGLAAHDEGIAAVKLLLEPALILRGGPTSPLFASASNPPVKRGGGDKRKRDFFSFSFLVHTEV